MDLCSGWRVGIDANPTMGHDAGHGSRIRRNCEHAPVIVATEVSCSSNLSGLVIPIEKTYVIFLKPGHGEEPA